MKAECKYFQCISKTFMTPTPQKWGHTQDAVASQQQMNLL